MTRGRMGAPGRSALLPRLVRLGMAALVSAAGVTAAAAGPAAADEPGRTAPSITVTSVTPEQPENQLSQSSRSRIGSTFTARQAAVPLLSAAMMPVTSLVCPPLCPSPNPPIYRTQAISMRWTDTWLGESTYKLYRYDGLGGNGTLVHEVGPRSGTGTVHTFRATRLEGNLTHCFRLFARTTSGRGQAASPLACAATGRPGRPGNPSVVWTDATSADIEFARSTSYEAPYRIYQRRSTESSWSPASQGTGAGTPPSGRKRYRVHGLQPGTTYSFRVTSAHAFQESLPTIEASARTATSPTAGWTEFSDDFTIEHPWDLPASDRYRYDASYDTHTTWVESTDEPLREGNPTNPRTEMRWDDSYSSGQRMWEADVYIPAGTDGSNIMQILRTQFGVDFMMRVYEADNGTLKRHPDGHETIVTGIYDRWINIKVAHNTATRAIDVYLDDRKAFTTTDNGPGGRRFKNGTYGSREGKAEARFRHITFWRR